MAEAKSYIIRRMYMSYFYWMTADTEQAIELYSRSSEQARKSFYLLQPNGLPPLEMSVLEKDVELGIETAYAWLAKTNLGVEDSEWGIALYHCASITTYNGAHYYCKQHIPEGVIDILGSILKSQGEIARFIGLDDYEQSVVMVLDSGKEGVTCLNKMWLLADAKKRAIRTFLPEFFPLKFSNNRFAIYEEFPSSGDIDG